MTGTMRTCKFKKGDEVMIVNYGHRIWSYEPMAEGYKVYDINPGLIGQKGIIDNAHLTQGIPTYSINGPTKHAWYDEQQLELLSAPEDKTVRSDSVPTAEKSRD